ncbi:PH domain-containing protein [Neomicrococcus lactis]|uniref:PH domain-containing protein n=1 Tax=Neomicrococcus lactis TaxID=732241 RepID=UPI002300DA37|nr:PH domain-containing protein [Neomicrococcus lactis]
MPHEPIDPVGIEWSRVSEKYLKVRVISALIGHVVFVVILSVPLVMRLLGVWTWPAEWIAWALPIAGLIWTIIDVLFIIPRQVRAIGYAERQEDLLIRSGIMFRKLMVVPYGRMQYVDVEAGPVDRAFGLCKVKMHTASPSANPEIPGIPETEGARLREQLSARGEAKLAGL